MGALKPKTNHSCTFTDEEKLFFPAVIFIHFEQRRRKIKEGAAFNCGDKERFLKNIEVTANVDSQLSFLLCHVL